MKDPLFNDEVQLNLKMMLYSDDLKKLALVKASNGAPDYGDVVKIIAKALADQFAEMVDLNLVLVPGYGGTRTPWGTIGLPIDSLWEQTREKYGVLDQLADI